MKIFETVRDVLDELYAEISPSETREAQVRASLQELTTCYKNLHAGHAVDYHDAAKRFAYVFRYVTLHSDIIKRTVESEKSVLNLFGDKKLRIACLGGGPGTDLLGVLKLMDEVSVINDVTFYLLDREATWQDSWSDISDSLNPGGKIIGTSFTKMDVEDEGSWFETKAWLKSDIYIASFFYSELHRIQEKAKVFFLSVMEKMKHGSYFIYIDNNSAAFTDGFHRLAQAGGLELINSKSDERLVLDTGEDSQEIEKYKKIFGSPRLTANVVMRIYRKVVPEEDDLI